MLALVLLLQAVPAVTKPIPKETTKPAVLWASSDAFRTCYDATQATLSALQAQMAAHLNSEDRAAADVRVSHARNDESIACKPAMVIQLPAGTALELSSNFGPCAFPDSDKTTPRLARARLTTGKDIGTTGCVLVNVLRDPVAF